jgi:hypothetical protein
MQKPIMFICGREVLFTDLFPTPVVATPDNDNSAKVTTAAKKGA